MNLDIGETLFEKLRVLVTDDRVYPDILEYDTKTTPAYLVYKTESQELNKAIDGTTSFALISVTVECYEQQKDAVALLAREVINTLDMSKDESRGITNISFIGSTSGYLMDDSIWFESLSFDIFKTS